MLAEYGLENLDKLNFEQFSKMFQGIYLYRSKIL